MQTNDPMFPLGSLPDNYQEVLYWRITGQPARLIALNLLGVFLFVVFCAIFSALAASLGELPSSFEFSGSGFGMLILGIVLALILHELTHGIAMRIFGAKPRYGVLWGQMMFYATAPGFAFHRNDYVIIALAPLVVLSILVVLGMWLLQGTWWVAFLIAGGVINASGAVGDMWITLIVLRYPAAAYVMDERDGVRVFLPTS
jgi:hypothetical protein